MEPAAAGLPGHALRHVPGARRPHALGQSPGIRGGDGIARPPQLEGSDGLEALELEEDLGGGVLDGEADERRAQHVASDPLRRGADLRQRDHARYCTGMAVRILSQADVEALLSMESCIDVMAEALGALARGEATMPLRSLLWKKDRSGLLGLMPAYRRLPPPSG
jgi:hypothetical protein